MWRRKETRREAFIAAVVEAWNDIPARDKPDLMQKQPALYLACGWLSAHEIARGLRRRGAR